MTSSRLKGTIALTELQHVISWQRVEGVALMGFFAFKFFELGVAWWWLPLILFTFDISMLGYLVNNKVGAFCYNLGHTSILSLVLLLLGHYYPSVVAYNVVGFIWLVHIGMDRAFGFGLKLHKGFRHTHLGIIGTSDHKS